MLFKNPISFEQWKISLNKPKGLVSFCFLFNWDPSLKPICNCAFGHVYSFGKGQPRKSKKDVAKTLWRSKHFHHSSPRSQSKTQECLLWGTALLAKAEPISQPLRNGKLWGRGVGMMENKRKWDIPCSFTYSRALSPAPAYKHETTHRGSLPGPTSSLSSCEVTSFFSPFQSLWYKDSLFPQE